MPSLARDRHRRWRGDERADDEAHRAERISACSKLYEPEGPADLDELTGPVYWPDLTPGEARQRGVPANGAETLCEGALIWTTTSSPTAGSSTPVMSKPSRRSATRSQSPTPRSLLAPPRSTGTGPYS